MQHFFPTQLLYFFIETVLNVSQLPKFSKTLSLKGLGTSYKQKLSFSCEIAVIGNGAIQSNQKQKKLKRIFVVKRVALSLLLLLFLRNILITMTMTMMIFLLFLLPKDFDIFYVLLLVGFLRVFDDTYWPFLYSIRM